MQKLFGKFVSYSWIFFFFGFPIFPHIFTNSQSMFKPIFMPFYIYIYIDLFQQRVFYLLLAKIFNNIFPLKMVTKNTLAEKVLDILASTSINNVIKTDITPV